MFVLMLNDANGTLFLGVFWDIPSSLLHLSQCDGDKVRDRNVVSDEKRRVGPGWRTGRLRPVHR